MKLHRFDRALRLLRREGFRSLLDRVLLELRRPALRRPALPWLLLDPEDAAPIGMTSLEERAFLRAWAERTWDGQGEIVDLGSWLGSSAIPLARGVRNNPRCSDPRGRVHAYDRFRWESWMAAFLDAGLDEGDSFEPLFLRQLGDLAALVTPHAGDLAAATWPPGAQIALLFHDAAKTPELDLAVRRAFFPALSPGSSLLIDQDFAHWFAPWVHLSRFRLRASLEPLLHLPASGSLVFRVAAPFEVAELERPVVAEALDDAEVAAAFEWALSLVTPPMGANVWAARVKLELDRGRLDHARRHLARARELGLRGLDLRRAAAALGELRGAAAAP